MDDKQSDKPVGENQEPKPQPKSEDVDLVFTPYITIKGKRIYHPTGGVFVFPRYTKKMV